MKIIKVPDIQHPTLCYKQASSKDYLEGRATHPMVRCGKKKKHKGKHSWEK